MRARGRLGAIAGSGWIRRLDGDVDMRSNLSYGISVRSLKPFRSATKAKKQPDAAAIREWRLRDAFKRYRVDCGRIHPTATELRKNVSKIVKAARRFVESPTLDLADRLLERLELDRNTEAAIRRGLEIPGREWIRFKQELRNLRRRAGRDEGRRATLALPESSVAVVIGIARVDPQQRIGSRKCTA
jgi:hypothetical protein